MQRGRGEAISLLLYQHMPAIPCVLLYIPGLWVRIQSLLKVADPVFGKGFGARFGSGSDFTVESDPVFLVELVPDPYFSRVSKPDPYFFEFRICIVVERRI